PYEDQLRDLREAARTLDLQVHELRVSTDGEIDLAFKTVAQQRIGAIMVTAGPFFDTRREKLVTLASHYAVPTMYHFREFSASGGGRCRASGRVASCAGASLSIATGARDCWLYRRQCVRHPRASNRSMAVGKAGPAIPCRKPTWCWHQHRHRGSRARPCRRLHASLSQFIKRHQRDALRQTQLRVSP